MSAPETAANLAEPRRMAEEGTQASWVWITPPPVDEERERAYPNYRNTGRRWRADDAAAVRAAILARQEPVVDLTAVFGTPSTTDLLGEDGVHPTPTGHRAIVRAVVEFLTS
ncbi:SGNH/GDSL hydrolase family protein [Solihabitans fulvus]|uniref:SGNH/GDSL hydrolase family protein n=1 Tax=Solihabitans fulvus TaxID=1892852 RepID=A0A5B2X0V0_9PSEU|nr:SGNH/GDSL hydrolase family protein [Solihabitans fulvus]KAA2256067.1 SGNH/GDSL hydrolase family protein [Solihabitans fulvus]